MSRRERQQRRQRGRRRGARGRVFVGLVVLLTAAGVVALAAVGYVVGVAATAPSISSLKPINQGTPSQVFAVDGKRLGFIQSDELRSPVPWSQIPDSPKDATIAIEDER